MSLLSDQNKEKIVFKQVKRKRKEKRKAMEGGNVFDGSNNMATVLLQNDQRLPPSTSSCEVLDSLWMANSSSPSFHGTAPMVNFGKKTRERPLFPQSDKEENGSEDYARCFHQPEKKRRLTPEQVQFLERTFDVENKLEPERKIQLAKEVGLQPRQVAIWFQNRRARYKTKQLEKDYDSLKASFDKLKADYDNLFKENEKLKNEVHLLKEKSFTREKGKVKSEPCDPISPSDAEPEKLIPTAVSENVSSVPIAVCKQEDASSVRSDVFDSDSPHYTDGNHSSLLEPDDSSHVFEPDLSDFSHDEDDSLRKSLLCAPSFPKLEDECYNDLQANSCMLGLTVEDPGTWFWNY